MSAAATASARRLRGGWARRLGWLACLGLCACAAGAGPHPAGDADPGDAPGDAAAPGDTADAGDGAPPSDVAACADIASQTCFSSYDCPAEQHCRDVGTPAAWEGTVVCCVSPAAGSDLAGTPCVAIAGQQSCRSGLCLDNGQTLLCTDRCTTAADCPMALPNCSPIAFSGSSERWCLP